jgi:haloacetate dehalogenase
VHGDVLQVWQRDYATNAGGGSLPCGHYVPEEAPEETLEWLLRHFRDKASEES